MDSTDKPNILLIHADQHRFDCLGIMGNSEIKTPNIDALANDGIVYSNCFATLPVCTPSRYSLLTGLYVHQHLGWSNHSTLPHGLPTFPRILRDDGYKTACVGKMHFTPTYSDVGFDTMRLSEQDGPGRFNDDYHRYLMEKDLVDFTDQRDQIYEYRSKAPQEYRNNFGSEKSNLSDEDYSTTWIGRNAIELVNEWDSGGNLLMVGFIKPHHPFDCPDPWSSMYNSEDLTLLPGYTEECLDLDQKYSGGFFDNSKLTKSALKQVMAQYYASITQIDHYVGELIKILKEKNLYDNTLIIYTSDHGDYMGFHHMLLKGNYMYDPVIKVPLIIKYPDSEYKGEFNENLVSNIDVTATILDVAECGIPQTLWGSVQPLIDADPRDVVFAETNGNNYMVRTKNRKLLLCQGHKSQFIKLDEDPNELNNLIDDPSVQNEVTDLKEMLFEWLAFSGRSQIHVDENDGHVNKATNTIVYGDEEEEKIKQYYKNKMNNMI